MKIVTILLGGLALALVASCQTTRPVGNGNVEALERQAPVTADPNSVGDAINAGNAVNYSNGGNARGFRGQGFGW